MDEFIKINNFAVLKIQTLKLRRLILYDLRMN